MACKSCGDPHIDGKYRCDACDVKLGQFRWCVITDVPRKADGSDDEGNLYDHLVDLKDVDSIVLRGHYIDFKARKDNRKKGMVNIKMPVFQVGEIFPANKRWSGREIAGGLGRKPGKWDIDYELFSSRDYKKAILRAIQARAEYEKPYDNLRHLESKFNKRNRNNQGQA